MGELAIEKLAVKIDMDDAGEACIGLADQAIEAMLEQFGIQIEENEICENRRKVIEQGLRDLLSDHATLEVN
jgi:hypothetical protein